MRGNLGEDTHILLLSRCPVEAFQKTTAKHVLFLCILRLV